MFASVRARWVRGRNAALFERALCDGRLCRPCVTTARLRAGVTPCQPPTFDAKLLTLVAIHGFLVLSQVLRTIGSARIRQEDAVERELWHRRDVLKTMSLAAAGALTGCASGWPSRTQRTGSVKFSAGTGRPKLKAPVNATDCHHHIYNSQYPVDPTATLRPPDASVEDYRALQRRLGTSRNVLVQPSTYGTDNRAHLEALAAFGPSARMVAVVNDGGATDELKRMHAAGVRMVG